MAPWEDDFQCLFAVLVHRISKSLITKSRRRWKGCGVTKWNEDHYEQLTMAVVYDRITLAYMNIPLAAYEAMLRAFGQH